jgi:hypothetical protein
MAFDKDAAIEGVSAFQGRIHADLAGRPRCQGKRDQGTYSRGEEDSHDAAQEARGRRRCQCIDFTQVMVRTLG